MNKVESTGPEISKRLTTYSHLSPGRKHAAFKKICVIGLGYIGLPTAALLASRGYSVLGVDIRKELVELVNSGNVHISEPDLDVLVQGAVQSNQLVADSVPASADVFIISVPTPFREANKPDLRYVESATRAIAPHVERGSLVILESTCPVGTTEQISTWLSEERPDLFTDACDGKHGEQSRLRIAYCPERVLPGNIIQELVENNRVVGGIDDISTEAAAEFYRSFVNGNVTETDSRTAEMSKLAENTFRDINIAYANELSMICDQYDIDVWNLIHLANLHPRVNILNPGAGVGGHCIAVDPWFLYNLCPEKAGLIRAARTSNTKKEAHIVQQVERSVQEGSTIAIFGLSYKADVGDLRESPSVRIVSALASGGQHTFKVVDPFVQALPAELASHNAISLSTMEEVASVADAIVILVRHKPFIHYFSNLTFDGPVLDFVNIT